MNKFKERRTPKYPDVNRPQSSHNNASELNVAYFNRTSVNDHLPFRKLKLIHRSHAHVFSALNYSDPVAINNSTATFQFISRAMQLYFNHTTVISKSGSGSP